MSFVNKSHIAARSSNLRFSMANCRSARAFFALIRSSLSISFFACTYSIIYSSFLFCSFSWLNLCSLSFISSAFSFSLRFCDSWRWMRSDPVAVRRFLFLIFLLIKAVLEELVEPLEFSTIPWALYLNLLRLTTRVYL